MELGCNVLFKWQTGSMYILAYYLSFLVALSRILLQSLLAWSKHCIIISVHRVMRFRGKFWFKDQWIGTSYWSILSTLFFYVVFPLLSFFLLDLISHIVCFRFFPPLIIHGPTNIFVGCAAMYGHMHATIRFWMWLINHCFLLSCPAATMFMLHKDRWG